MAWILVGKTSVFSLLFTSVCWLLLCRKGIFHLNALISSLAFCGAVVNKSGTVHVHPKFVEIMIESSIHNGIFCLQ